MKKIFLVVFAFLTIASTTTSSASGIYFGPKLGMNISSLSKLSNASSRARLQLGGFVGYKMLDILSLQGEVLYSMQGAKVDGINQPLNYLKIPIMAKLSIIGNLEVEGGLSFNFLVGSNKYKPTGERLKNFDMSIPIGLTYTFLKRIMVGLRYDLSLVEVDVPHVKNVRNDNWSISVGFKF